MSIDVSMLAPGRYRLTFEVDIEHKYGQSRIANTPVSLGSQYGLTKVGEALVAVERVCPFEHGQVYRYVGGQETATWVARSGGHLLELIEGRYADYAGDDLDIYDSVNPNDDPEYFSQLVRLTPEAA